MTDHRLSTDELDGLVSAIQKKFGIVMGPSGEKAREKAASMVKDLSLELGENPDRIFLMILERSDQAFIERISPHITVGETYFFRDRKALNSFKTEIVPQLSSSAKRPIKIWSAGCSTGEEPYSLAMILEDSTLALGDGFRVYGTDLNGNSLKKAKRGIYGRWSFRGMNEAEVLRYFEPFEEGLFRIKDRYRSRVSFDSINLIDSALPWRNGEIDVIFCRNVMMYFDDKSRRKVLQSFMEALSPEGWLVVAACETSLLEGTPFSAVHFDGQTFFSPSVKHHPPVTVIDDWSPDIPLWDHYGDHFQRESSEPIEWEEDRLEEATPEDSRDTDEIRSLADRGMLEEALEVCLSLGNSTDPYVHYLTSTVHQGRGDFRAAKESLRRAIFLDPSFVIAHYSLVGIAISEGNHRDRDRHMRNALELLLEMKKDEAVPYGEGATAGDLISGLKSLS